jgi:lipopolysaccharide export system ATP-binding protein
MILRAEHLFKQYKKRLVVNDVSVQVAQGEIVGLLGPNGAGKTTSFYMMVGLVKPNAGKIFIDDREITKLPMYKRAKLGVGYLAQEASVFRHLTVEQNIMSVLEMRREISKKEAKQIVDELIEEFSLTKVRKSLGIVLSGGERRRTEIARALAVKPKFILLDEPFAGVDPVQVGEIQQVVAKLKDKNIGILITDHNVRETLSITERAYILTEGKILVQGKTEEIIHDPVARKAYLTDNVSEDLMRLLQKKQEQQ